MPSPDLTASPCPDQPPRLSSPHAPPPKRYDLRWELLPLFLIVLSFALGFIFYGQRISPLYKTGAETYGPDWDLVFGCVQWGIPAAGFGVYLFLSAGMWAVGRVKDPVKDWNALARRLGRPTVDDPARKEQVRRRLLHAQYLFKLALLAVGLFAQWQYFEVISSKLGISGP